MDYCPACGSLLPQVVVEGDRDERRGHTVNLRNLGYTTQSNHFTGCRKCVSYLITHRPLTRGTVLTVGMSYFEFQEPIKTIASNLRLATSQVERSLQILAPYYIKYFTQKGKDRQIRRVRGIYG